MPNAGINTGNRGEWSEIYVFLKLLADGQLFSADENLNKIPTLFYPILEILRNDAIGPRHYVRDAKILIVDPVKKKVLLEVEIAQFVAASKLLLAKIKQSASSSFEVKEITAFLQTIDVQSLKARSADKRDITVIVHDSRTNMDAPLGFSIKSNLGSPSTLLNPGKTTNFIYRIEGDPFTTEEIQQINAIDTGSKVRDRLVAIRDAGRQVEYFGMENRNFNLNLQMIDTVMPDIVAEMVLLFFSGQGNSIKDLVDLLEENNPLDFDLGLEHPLYQYKMKALLTDIALGMTPAASWKGKYDATGGYIIVKDDGDILCYHIYNRNEFQTYLLDNTRLDTPSTTRYEYATVYSEGDRQFIKLNLQVRFK